MPPPTPAFDLCEELGVSRTSTSAEITAAYHLLALIHHPDKNRDSPEATARFQRIQASYETLTDPDARSACDSREASHSSSASRYDPSWADDLGSSDEFEVDVVFDDFIDGFRYYSTTYASQQKEYQRGEAVVEETREQLRAQFQKQERAARAERREAEAKKKAENEEAQRKYEEEIQKNKMAERKAELDLQENVWASHNADTTGLRQLFGNHTNFWDKTQSEKKGAKIRCGKCTQRRSMHGFQCHLCELIICQVCLN